MDKLAVILPAAGSSSRFQRDKLAVQLQGKSVLDRVLDAFLRRDDVAQVIVVGRELPRHGSVHAVPGGESRAESVLNALRTVGTDIAWVAIHDAARPLVSQALIDRTFAAAREFGAAAPAMPVQLTIKQATGPLPSFVDRTIARNTLWAMQTPQIARRSALLAAYDHCPLALDEVTDDMQLLELAGQRVRLVPGDEFNIKLTHPIDLASAEYWLAQDVLGNGAK